MAKLRKIIDIDDLEFQSMLKDDENKILAIRNAVNQYYK